LHEGKDVGAEAVALPQRADVCFRVFARGRLPILVLDGCDLDPFATRHNGAAVNFDGGHTDPLALDADLRCLQRSLCLQCGDLFHKDVSPFSSMLSTAARQHAPLWQPVAATTTAWF